MSWPDLREEPGWFGLFTRAQARDAIPNGARIVKKTMEPGDAHAPGELGTVIGSFWAVDPRTVVDTLMYFVEWDDRPRVAVGLLAYKIGRAV